MSSSKGKSSSSLRILWIPGRKKHNRKGVYNPTKSSIPQFQAHQQRKNQLWTLGGNVNHNKIIYEDLHDNLDVGMAAATGAMTLVALSPGKPGEASSSTSYHPELTTADDGASCNVNGTQAVELVVLNDLNGDISKKDIPTNNQFEALELIDECEEKDRNYSNAESSSSLLSSNNDSRSADYMHNSATLAIGEARRHRRRNSYNNSKKDSCENLDSIDHINDNDAVDAVKITAEEPRLDTFRQTKKKNKKKNHPNYRQGEPDDDDDETNKKDKDEKLVTCLYYSLVCWDCSIS